MSKNNKNNQEETMQALMDIDSLMQETDIENYQIPEDEPKSGGTVYSPKAPDGQKDKYFAVIRLLKNPYNINSPITKRTQVYANEPELGLSRYFDTLENWGEKCPIKTKFWQYFNLSKTQPHLTAIKDKLSSSTAYYCLAQVVKDSNRPELEGKVVVFKFSERIKNYLFSKMRPPKEVLDSGIKPIDPFDLFDTGKNLILNLEVSSIVDGVKYTDYSKVQFSDDTSPVFVWDEPGNPDSKKHKITKDAKGKMLLEELYKDAPKLSDYEPQRWDEETKDLVEEWLNFIDPKNLEKKKNNNKQHQSEDIDIDSSDNENSSSSNDISDDLDAFLKG